MAQFKRGDQVLYTRANRTPVAAVVQNVHFDDAAPYYTVSITSTGREVNTDAGHLQYGAQARQSGCRAYIVGGTQAAGELMGARVGEWKHCPLITQAHQIARDVRTVTHTHKTSITSSYNTKHGYAEVTSCTREFFQNLYDHAKQRTGNGLHTSLFMRRAIGEHSADGKLLEEMAYTLNAPKEDGTTAEFARVQITPTRGGRGTLLAFAQEWKTGALNNSHLLLHSKKRDVVGNAGGFGEGFKVAANSLLARFPNSSAEPCNILMVMNGRTWRFCYRNFETDGTVASSEKIDQFVVDEYTTKVYGGMVVFVEIPMSATSIERIWNPDHYIPTMSSATWTPLLPPGASPVMSYVLFLEDSNAPSKFFQLGIYVGTVDNSKGAFFNEGGSVNIGRDRGNTSDVLSNIRTAIAKRVKLLPAGTRDDAVMERLMVNPDALGREARWYGSRVLYKSVVSYVRSRDRVPDTTEIFLVDAEIASEVTECLRGAQVNVHVVSAEKELWTYGSNEEVSKALMTKTFAELSDSERQHFQVELQILATISPSWCVWVLGKWPGTYFQAYMGQSKRYFHDTVSNRYLVPAVLLQDQAFWPGLCMDAWTLSKLDPYIFMQRAGSDHSILRDPNRVRTMVTKAREQAASGNGLLVGTDSNRDASPEGAVEPPPPSAIFGGKSDRPPNSDSGGSAVYPANGQPPSVGGSVRPRRGMADQPQWFPPPTLKDPSGLSIGGQSGRSNDIVDSVDEDEETRFKPGPLRYDLGVELFVAQGVSDLEASRLYDRFMTTPGVIDALHAIFLTARSFHFAYKGIEYGPVREPVVRLFAAGPSCRTLGFNIVNDRALWINISALLGEDGDQRTVVAGLVRTAMHELAHACTPGCGHGCTWDVAQSLANQTFYHESFSAGLRDRIWHPSQA